MKNEYIPINKGNYSMETVERERLFEEYRGEGWEKEYKEYRKNWSEYPQKKIVSEYPLNVDIEISSVCNLKCPMCFTITDSFKKIVNCKLMEEEVFYKIIDEIAGKVPAVRLSLRGESTLHPHLIDFIKYCKSKNIGEVSFLTNGSKLTKDYFEKIMNAGADWITISIDGVGQTYDRIRKPNNFDDIYQKIKDIKQVKDNAKSHKPVIKIQSIWPAIKNNPSEFYNLFSPYVDLIAFNPLIDYLGNDDENDILYEDNFSCPQLYQRLIICADGLASMCTNNERNDVIIGDANNESIYDIWHGDKLTQIRNLHNQKNGFLNMELCKHCFIPRATEENETAEVNGRKFCIKNYINRSQEIGK